MSVYTGGFMEHFKRPRNVGEVEDPEIIWEATSSHCQDRVRFSYGLKGDLIVDIRFLARGCGVLIASASLLTEYVKGKRVAEILEDDGISVKERLDPLPPKKERCFFFAWQALREGLLTTELSKR